MRKYLSLTGVFFAFMLFLAGAAKAQPDNDTLSFRHIFAIALENNFQLRILANDAEIAENNNTAGNAGFLPSLDVGATDNKTIVNSEQTFYDGRTRSANGANNNSFSAFAELNWTVFDGMKMWAASKRLDELENMGRMNLQLQVELTYLELAAQYYRLVQEQKLLEVFRSTLEVSRARLSLAEKKFMLGAASEVDVNQARIDKSNDSAQYIRQEVLLRNLAADINVLAGRSPEISFAAGKDIALEGEMDYQEMYSAMMTQNYSILLVKSEARVKFQEIREKRAEMMPSLSVYANYAYSNVKSETGLLETSTTDGPAFGFNLSYNLFNGFNSRREMQNSRIDYNSAEMRTDEVINAMHADLYKTYNTYIGASQEVSLENANVVNAAENLKIAIELYRSGAINEIEFRDIQLKALEAENRLLAAEYIKKLAGLSLKQISGMLEF
jgi:outer membrane protein TolC